MIWTPPKFGNVPFGPELTRGLVGYWPLDDQGGIAYDRSGYGNHGTLVGNTVTVISTRGRCLSFDGAGDWVDAGNVQNILGQGKTYSFWVKTDSVHDGGILHKNPLGSAWNGITAEYKITSNRFLFYVNGTTASSGGFINDYYNNDLGKWVHTVVVLDNSNTVTIYKNAIAQTLTGGGTYNTPSENNEDLLIGTNYYSSYRSFNGSIDEVMIFNRALSAQEVQQLYLYGLYKRRDPIELWTAASPASGTIIPLIQYYNQQARA